MTRNQTVDAVTILVTKITTRAIEDSLAGAEKPTGEELVRTFGRAAFPGDVRNGDALQHMRVYSAARWFFETHGSAPPPT
jgi:hypothetical protein